MDFDTVCMLLLYVCHVLMCGKCTYVIHPRVPRPVTTALSKMTCDKETASPSPSITTQEADRWMRKGVSDTMRASTRFGNGQGNAPRHWSQVESFWYRENVINSTCKDLRGRRI